MKESLRLIAESVTFEICQQSFLVYLVPKGISKDIAIILCYSVDSTSRSVLVSPKAALSIC